MQVMWPLIKPLRKIQETGDLPVPLAIRNAPTKLMKDLNYGKGYQYAHNYEGSFSAMEFLPDALQGTKFLNLAIMPGKKN